MIELKKVEGWACDCRDDHPSPECEYRYRIVTEIPTDPEWRAPQRSASVDVSRETDLPPEIYAYHVFDDDPEVPKAARPYMQALTYREATYARGYPPGTVAEEGQCP